MAEFNNPGLKQALQAMKQDQSVPVVHRVLDEFRAGKVLAPAKWDKDPVKQPDGSMMFEPDTKISLMILQNQNGEQFFPVFSDMQSVRDWNSDPSVQNMILDFNQLMNFVTMAKDQVSGIVANPNTDNIPFKADFLIGAKAAMDKSPLSPHKLSKGDKVFVREPELDVTEMKDILNKVGQSRPEVNSIYLKERVEPDESTHWFIIVDTDSPETSVFEAIGRALKGHTYGKEVEFIFGKSPLAQKMMERSTPVYLKTVQA